MKIIKSLLTAFAIAFTNQVSGQQTDKIETDWQSSIVLLDITRNNHNFRIPWDKRAQSVSKFGVVIKDKELITTATGLANHTLIRIQKGGRGKWTNGKVLWIDYQANLAVLGVESDDFWKDLKPVKFAESKKLKKNLQVIRWRGGNIEKRAAEFSRFTVADANFNQAPRIELKASSEIEGAGQAELMVSGDKVVGLVASKISGTCSVIPAPFITDVIRLRESNNYNGLGYFDFIWQPASNPAVTDYFKLEGEPRGVLVIKPGEKSPLKLHDIILEVDGFPIDIQGDYLDPDFGHVIMEYLACRHKWAGDIVNFKIWRDGKIKEIDFKLPKADFSDNLVTDRPNDVEPTYLIVGGLVFVPLSAEFLSSWGGDWQRSAPFRLVFYNNQKANKDQKSLVVLSLVLPDFYNIGYQQRSSQNIVIEKANGKLIASLDDLAQAIKSPKDGFHIFEFKKGSTLKKIILNAEKLDEANQRITKRYGIPKLQKLK